MKRHSNPTQAILEKYHYGCQYCGEAGSGVDHIIPYSYLNGHGGTDNLVSACQSCNSIAGDKVFESFQEKRAYILARRAELKKDKPKNICPDCGLAFRPKLSSVICNRCYRRSERGLRRLAELRGNVSYPSKPLPPPPQLLPEIKHPKRIRDNRKPVAELAPTFTSICEIEYQNIYEIVAEIGYYLEMGQETRHYRTRDGKLLPSLDSVIQAILSGNLIAVEAGEF